jgi:hypothetical protein
MFEGQKLRSGHALVDTLRIDLRQDHDRADQQCESQQTESHQEAYRPNPGFASPGARGENHALED